MTMNSKTILSGADFSPSSDVKYSKPKVDARGSKSIGIANAASNGATYISTPLMITWGRLEPQGAAAGPLARQLQPRGQGFDCAGEP